MPEANPAQSVEIDRIVEALGSAVQVPYAPPNIFPMSAPKFLRSPCAERARQPGDLLSIYVHVPFCNYACTFCFYAKRVGDGYERMERYARALQRELEWVEPGTRLSHLYVGGGTPTVLPAELLDKVLAGVFGRMRPCEGAIHTVECSPESISPEHVRVLRDRDIARVSVGIQSLSDEVLDTVNRRHDRKRSLAAVDLLLRSGFVVNVDLIYGLPGQTEANFCEDFEALAAGGVHSVTAYNLRVNERTPVVKDMREEDCLDLVRLIRWRALVKRTADELGFVQTRCHTFERINGGSFAVPRGFEGDQFGVGLSARSRLDRTIWRNHVDLDVYVGRVEAGMSPIEEIFPLQEKDRKIRFIAETLGDGQPLERVAYERSFGCSLEDDFGDAPWRLRKAGLVEDVAGQISFTETGKLVYDLVMLAFYPQHTREWLAERQRAAFKT
jgi:oxygen-independent coproporphyrinogen-3 oxidase